jgi:predicted transcriptional regulator
MKRLDVKQLDEKDEEIADALIAIGMNRNIARTPSYLQNVDAATSVELERVARMRQPEISIAMKLKITRLDK